MQAAQPQGAASSMRKLTRASPCQLLELERAGEVQRRAARAEQGRAERPVGGAERDRAHPPARGVLQHAVEMALADPPHLEAPRRRQHEARLGVAAAERPERAKPRGEAGRQRGDLERAVEREIGRRRRPGPQLAREALAQEPLERCRACSARTVRPAAIGWPPPWSRSPAWRAAITARAEIEARHRARRALADLARQADHQRRPVVALDQARCGEPRHARRPALARDAEAAAHRRASAGPS